jgi:hypothetical protein
MTATSTLPKLTIRYKYGQMVYYKYGGSAAQVQQVLTLIQDEMRAVAGDYTWALTGDTHSGYAITATYPGGMFVDARGKTPGEALRNLYPATVVLKNYFGKWA